VLFCQEVPEVFPRLLTSAKEETTAATITAMAAKGRYCCNWARPFPGALLVSKVADVALVEGIDERELVDRAVEFDFELPC
jgi:hypothetical protein